MYTKCSRILVRYTTASYDDGVSVERTCIHVAMLGYVGVMLLQHTLSLNIVYTCHQIFIPYLNRIVLVG